MTIYYVLNRELFEDLLKKRGFRNHLDFCRKMGIHKNTLNYYLSGRDVFSKKLYEIADALGVDAKELIISTSPTIPEIEEIENILSDLTSILGVAVVLLGSRAKGRAKKYSDWDLGITRGDNPITSREFLRIRGRVEELAENLPRKLDVVNLDAAPEWFLESIDYEPLMLAGDSNSFNYFKGVIYGIREYKIKKVA